jgi:TalC/MipB family fructose-6-phosphate aldolase
MEFILDTANLSAIEKALDLYPIDGVTTNPSILAKEGAIDVFAHLKAIQKQLGPDRSLHVQTLSDTAEGIMAEAAVLRQHLGNTIYVKIPTTPQGLKAMKHLHAQGVRITATAITSKLQAFLAINAGADYLAPYVNRMANLDIDAMDVLSSISTYIANAQSSTKIVAASFKNLAQINAAIEAGVQAVTVDPSLFDAIFSSAPLAKAVSDFTRDFEARFGSGKNLTNL